MDYQLTAAQITGLIILALWEMTWKGLALWRAGRCNEVGWFVAILVLNTAGVLPIIYLLVSSERIKAIKTKEAK